MAMSAARGQAFAVASVMRQEAAFENKPNHVRHVENQIRYADSVGEAVKQEIQEWIQKELPAMIQKELSKPQNQIKVQAKVDEKSLSDARKKITDMFKSIFK